MKVIKLLRNKVGLDNVRNKEYHQNLEVYGETAPLVSIWSPSEVKKEACSVKSLGVQGNLNDGEAKDIEFKNNGLK
ncbi:hypothetical protein [Fonticella tunisiensis]|uniref:Uncharacterized protein n=1 Tax=Fonticella tunisiensis TaxID=1096341 RepID=A0A4V3ES88_9CLOT|nr:hypothetical protein [Fonticella tunisiensis]TDT51242.1 hypothetical protein EDD71_12023 [Fonticella tunisiensis]